MSVGYFEDCNKRSTKYIYRMTAWIEDETDSAQIYLPNAEDETGLTQMFTEWWPGMLKTKWIQCNYVLPDDGGEDETDWQMHMFTEWQPRPQWSILTSVVTRESWEKL